MDEQRVTSESRAPSPLLDAAEGEQLIVSEGRKTGSWRDTSWRAILMRVAKTRKKPARIARYAQKRGWRKWLATNSVQLFRRRLTLEPPELSI